MTQTERLLQTIRVRMREVRVTDLAIASGLHRNMVQYVRDGKTNPTVATLVKLERALDALNDDRRANAYTER